MAGANGMASKGGTAKAATKAPISSSPARGFEATFSKAFNSLDRKGNNQVLIHDLRKAMPGVSRAQFDAGLIGLTRSMKFTMDTHEGHAGRGAHITDAHREGGLRQGNSHMMYVARRD